MLDTFELGDRDEYRRFWEGPWGNTHLAKGNMRVDWILAAAGGYEPDRILEIGCQTGGITRFLLEIAPVFVVDIATQYISAAMQVGVQPDDTLLCFVEDLHQQDIGYFGCVVMAEVLNHVHDAEKAIANAWSKVEPGGGLIITVPIGGRWTDGSTAREFNKPGDLKRILSAGTGYRDITVETMSDGGVEYFYVCNIRKRSRRGRA